MSQEPTADRGSLERRVVHLQREQQHLHRVRERDHAGQVARRRAHARDITRHERAIQTSADDGKRRRHVEHTFPLDSDGGGSAAG
jgi:hypothetical protein